MPQKINIAVDGFSSCGKSTLTKALAEKLGYRYVDTGAMYRSITLYFLEQKIEFDNKESVAQAIENISIDFCVVEGGKSHVCLNGEDVEGEIRSMRISKQVSEVAAISAVRTFLVAQQRAIVGSEGKPRAS